jgi:hypothetical protein
MGLLYPYNAIELLAVLLVREYVRRANLLVFGEMLAYKLQWPYHSF